MGKNHLKHGLLVGDLILIGVGFRIAFWLRLSIQGIIATEGKPTFLAYWAAIALAWGTWILLFQAFQLDSFYRLGWNFPLAVSRLLTALIVLMVVLLSGSYLSQAYYSRLVLAFLPFLLVAFFAAGRMAYVAVLRKLRKYRWGVRRVAIVGQSDLARELGRRILEHEELNYELAGYIYPAHNRKHEQGEMAPLETANSKEMARALASRKVDELIFTTPIRRDTGVLDFVAHCQEQGIQVMLIPEYYDLHVQQIESFSIDGIPIFELRENTLNPLSGFVKTALDYTIGLALFILFFPLMVVVGALLGILNENRVLRREGRVGLRGRPFVMYRFDVRAGERVPSNRTRDGKARFCRFLYLYSISELPQLWNVLKGDMSIVGPRPESAERVRHYSEWHMRRLQVKPGITGLAQVRGLRGFDSSDSKTKQDLEYVATFSPILDLTLMVATVGTLLGRRTAKVSAFDSTSPPPPAPGNLQTDLVPQRPRS